MCVGAMQVCRLCSSRNGLSDVFHPDIENGQIIRESITLLTGIEIKRFSNLPTLVCNPCIKINLTFQRYRLQALANDIRIKKAAGILFLTPPSSPQEQELPPPSPLAPRSPTHSISSDGTVSCDEEVSVIPVSVMHPSIGIVLKNNRNVIIPGDVLRDDLLPTVILEANAIEVWYNRQISKKLGFVSIKKVTSSIKSEGGEAELDAATLIESPDLKRKAAEHSDRNISADKKLKQNDPYQSGSSTNANSNSNGDQQRISKDPDKRSKNSSEEYHPDNTLSSKNKNGEKSSSSRKVTAEASEQNSNKQRRSEERDTNISDLKNPSKGQNWDSSSPSIPKSNTHSKSVNILQNITLNAVPFVNSFQKYNSIQTNKRAPDYTKTAENINEKPKTPPRTVNDVTNQQIKNKEMSGITDSKSKSSRDRSYSENKTKTSKTDSKVLLKHKKNSLNKIENSSSPRRSPSPPLNGNSKSRVYLEDDKSNRKRTLSEHSSSSDEYICSLCNKFYDSQKDLLNHQKVHSKTSSIKKRKLSDVAEAAPPLVHLCTICNKFYDCQEDLDYHQRIHNEQKKRRISTSLVPEKSQPSKLFCSVCDDVYEREEDLQDHQKEAHFNYNRDSVETDRNQENATSCITQQPTVRLSTDDVTPEVVDSSPNARLESDDKGENVDVDDEFNAIRDLKTPSLKECFQLLEEFEQLTQTIKEENVEDTAASEHQRDSTANNDDEILTISLSQTMPSSFPKSKQVQNDSICKETPQAETVTFSGDGLNETEVIEGFFKKHYAKKPVQKSSAGTETDINSSSPFTMLLTNNTPVIFKHRQHLSLEMKSFCSSTSFPITAEWYSWSHKKRAEIVPNPPIAYLSQPVQAHLPRQTQQNGWVHSSATTSTSVNGYMPVYRPSTAQPPQQPAHILARPYSTANHISYSSNPQQPAQAQPYPSVVQNSHCNNAQQQPVQTYPPVIQTSHSDNAQRQPTQAQPYPPVIQNSHSNNAQQQPAQTHPPVIQRSHSDNAQRQPTQAQTYPPVIQRSQSNNAQQQLAQVQSYPPGIQRSHYNNAQQQPAQVQSYPPVMQRSHSNNAQQQLAQAQPYPPGIQRSHSNNAQQQPTPRPPVIQTPQPIPSIANYSHFKNLQHLPPSYSSTIDGPYSKSLQQQQSVQNRTQPYSNNFQQQQRSAQNLPQASPSRPHMPYSLNPQQQPSQNVPQSYPSTTHRPYSRTPQQPARDMPLLLEFGLGSEPPPRQKYLPLPFANAPPSRQVYTEPSLSNGQFSTPTSQHPPASYQSLSKSFNLPSNGTSPSSFQNNSIQNHIDPTFDDSQTNEPAQRPGLLGDIRVRNIQELMR